MKIVAIVPPFDRPETETMISPRRFDEVDRFADAVGHAAGCSIPVIEGSLADAPADAFVLLFGDDDLGANGPRVIAINADRSSVLDELEQHQLAGAVEKQRYFRWRTAPANEKGGGLFGRKAIAEVLEARLEKPFQTEAYGLFASSRYPDLPSLVAGYLAALTDDSGRRS